MTMPNTKTATAATRSLKRLVSAHFTPKQKALAKKHGTPAEFAEACYSAVPGWISMSEANVAVAKYQREWADAR